MQTFNESLAVKLFEEGTLSLGKAAELAGLPVERLIEVLGASGIAAVDYPPEELDDELARLAPQTDEPGWQR